MSRMSIVASGRTSPLILGRAATLPMVVRVVMHGVVGGVIHIHPNCGHGRCISNANA
jgi:hypothetical protein